MQVQRTIPIVVPNDPDVLAAVQRFQWIMQAVGFLAWWRYLRAPFEEAGPEAGNDERVGVSLPSAITLHHACYGTVKGLVSSQMTGTAIRLVAGAYRSAWRKGHTVQSHFAFLRPLAVWLIGDRRRGRDASLPEDGLLSLWTPAGRKRIPYEVPLHFRQMLDQAVRVNSLSVQADRSTIDNMVHEAYDDAAGDVRTGHATGNGILREPWVGGPLRAWLTVTIEVPDPTGHSPVGIDRGAVNALVAVDEEDRLLFLSGREHSVRNERTRQVREQVRQKLAVHQAQGKDTRSLRRLRDRLSRKQRNRTRTFAQQAALAVCRWAPPDAVFVLEDLHLPAHQPAHPAQTRGRLPGWFHGVLRQCLANKAQEFGIPVVTVPPAFTSLDCSVCGARGRRRGHRFVCPECGYTAHADVNAACNIRNAGRILNAERTEPET